MAKIILTDDGSLVREVPLVKERITIGRRVGNDIVIDDLAVSAEHAVIVTISNDSFLEDLNSTNGTQINGQPVKKHFLQDSDVIELAHFRLRYVSDGLALDSKPAQAEHEQSGRIAAASAIGEQGTVALLSPVIKILNGAKAGKKIMLTKPLTTIGRPGLQVAVITRRAEGYFLTHVEGDVCPVVNGAPIDAGPYLLALDDVIDFSGSQMLFTSG